MTSLWTDKLVGEAIASAVTAERERCARLCEQMQEWERKRFEEALAKGQGMAVREAKLIELTARNLAFRIRMTNELQRDEIRTR